MGFEAARKPGSEVHDPILLDRTNAEFTRALGRALGRPTVLPMPEAALKLLFGEMSELLLVSDRMLPKRLLDEGFEFRYPDLDRALANIFGK